MTAQPGNAGQRAPLIALRVPRELDERLRAHVAETGSSISDVVRGAIEDALAPSRSSQDAATSKAPVALAGRAKKRATVSRCAHRQPSGAFCAACDGIVP